MLAGLGALALMGAAGGGGGGSSNVITKIQAFATDGTQAAPTVDDYKALAVTGVTGMAYTIVLTADASDGTPLAATATRVR